MRLPHRLAAVCRGLVRRRQADADLDEELRTFVEMSAASHAGDGVPLAEARRRAALELGGVEQTKERVRRGRHGGRVDEMARDVRYALRQIRHNPGFSTVAITTLALGIGVSTAIFSAVDAVLIRPLPYPEAERLVMVWDNTNQPGEEKFFTTPPEWREWRRANTVFTDIAASQSGEAALSGAGEPEDLSARKVSGNFWNVLGVRPQIGRVFTDDEDVQGARVVVISHGFWQRRFGASPAIVGRTITLNDTAYEVLGVMPRDFYFMPARDVDVWMPTSFSPNLLRNWGWHDLHTVARLRPGVSVQQAADAMEALSVRVSAPHMKVPRKAVVTPLREELAGKTYASLIVLLGAAGAVLLIACVNLANLLMARGVARRREVALRAALGAGLGRLVAQFLVESLVLAGLGALAGLALAMPIMRFLETLVPQTMAAVDLRVDWRVLGFATMAALASGVTFGLAPALRGARAAVNDGLRDGGRGSAGGRSHRVQHTLVIVETALAVVLLTTGGLLLQTFQQLRQTDLGIRAENLLTFVTPLFRYPEFDRRVAFVEAQLERVRAVPGVVSVGAISRIPLTVSDQSTFYRLANQTNDVVRDQLALTRVVTRGYFPTVGAVLREGRFFDVSDRHSTAPVAVVSESFAKRNYPGRSALGERFKFGNLGERGYWYTIVGVVAEIRERGVAVDVRPAIYRVHEQADQTGGEPSGIIVRTAVEPTSIVPSIRAAIQSVDANQPIARVQTVEAIVATQLSGPTQNTVLLSALAMLALLLASIGLYGVLSYAVTQRTNEIGVRLALGATPGAILRAFTMRGLSLTLAGLAIGVVGALFVARLMSTLFYGLDLDYVPAIVVATVVLLMVAGLASVVPARRASRTDPLAALQE